MQVLGRPQLFGSAAYPGLMAAGQGAARYRNWIDELGDQYSEDFFIYDAVVPTLAQGASAVAQIFVQQDSAFEWLFAAAGAQSATTGTTFKSDIPAITVQVVDNMSSRNLFSAPIFLSCIGGTAQFPLPLPIPRRFMPKSQISVIFTNVESAATTWTNIRLSLIGRKIFLKRGGAMSPSRLRRFRSWQSPDPNTGGQKLLTEDLFAYSITVPALTVSGGATPSGVAQQLIEGDSDFEWLMTNGSFATSGASNVQIPVNQQLITMGVQDGGSGSRSLSLASTGALPTMIGVQCGAQGTPFILPVPRILLARTQVIVTLTNADSGTAIGPANIVLWGRKLFELG